MSAQPSRAGFTLVEMLIVVVIIAILALALGPSVGRTFMEQRLSAACRELVRLVRDARLATMAERRAHLVYINPSAGTARVLRGINNSCFAPNWQALDTACTSNTEGSAAGTECLSVDFGKAPWAVSGSRKIRLSEVPVAGGLATTAYRLCFAPNGPPTSTAGTSAARRSRASTTWAAACCTSSTW
jgi:prepilin-type N-terminal cleavage/methylation domain-containing protein